jgi:ATP-binding cassette, subfamily B, bacterial MsbA
MKTAVAGQPPGLYRRLLRYSAPHWKVFLLAMLGMVLFAGVDVSFIRLVQPMIDGSFVERDPDTIRMIPWAIMGLFILRGVAHFMSVYGMAWVSQRIVLQLRNEVFEQLLHLPVSHYDKSRNADLLVKLTYHVNQIAESGTSVLTAMIKDGLTVIGLLWLMFFHSWKLALITLLLAPVVAWSVRYVSKRFKTINERLQHSMGSVTHAADEAITGRRVVKVYGGEASEVRRFAQVGNYMRQQGMKLAASSAGSSSFVQLMAAMAISLIVYLASQPDMLREMTPGTFISFLGALLAMRMPLNALTGINERLSRGLVAAADLFQFLDAPRENPGGTRALARARGEILFEDVAFEYLPGGKRVLSEINLDVQPGQTVAFVGKSGSGKSTLLSLLPRFYDPTVGRIRLDGYDLRDYPLADLRRQIALVDQNVMLFNATVAENIAYGLPELDEARITAAAQAAYAWDFIEKLPQGLKTPVGQNGVTLSGGQRQRIAIARALLKDAPILILDEATSALDTESERYIQAALEKLVVGRTTLVIAHRLSTVQKADRIVVMSGGRIIESGSHAELLAREGAYAGLHRMQFAEDDGESLA